MTVLSKPEAPTQSKSNPRVKNLCRGLVKVAYHPVHPLNETILVATMHDHDTVPFSYNPLALALGDMLEYFTILDLVVAVGLNICGNSVQCVLESFLGGGIGHFWLGCLLAKWLGVRAPL